MEIKCSISSEGVWQSGADGMCGKDPLRGLCLFLKIASHVLCMPRKTDVLVWSMPLQFVNLRPKIQRYVQLFIFSSLNLLKNSMVYMCEYLCTENKSCSSLLSLFSFVFYNHFPKFCAMIWLFTPAIPWVLQDHVSLPNCFFSFIIICAMNIYNM